MTSYATGNFIINKKAGADLSADQYRALVLNTSGELIKAGANGQVIGFNHSRAAALGEVVELASTGGGAKAIAGATITANDRLKSDANGALIAITADTDFACARALESAVAGDVFEVYVMDSDVNIT